MDELLSTSKPPSTPDLPNVRRPTHVPRTTACAGSLGSNDMTLANRVCVMPPAGVDSIDNSTRTRPLRTSLVTSHRGDVVADSSCAGTGSVHSRGAATPPEAG